MKNTTNLNIDIQYDVIIMGVPYLFSWIMKKIKIDNIITDDINDDVDILYIDANCLFHPQCHKILWTYVGNDINELEMMMINQVLDYTQYIINCVRPKEVFIAVDGVAPMAKINQQRKRRYKAAFENEKRNEIKKNHGLNQTTIWTNTCITPGSVFMEKLHQHLLMYCKTLDMNCTYSSYHTRGEGEHKILQDVKKRCDCTCVIYGLDADLIFLSLSSGKDNLYLLREKVNFGSNNDDDELCYVSIDNVKLNVNKMFRELIGVNCDFINDFIVICYFLGNDFVPNLPSIDIRNGGMEFLIESYVKVYMKLGIMFYDGDINKDFLEMFMKIIASKEKYYFEVKYPNYIQSLQERSSPVFNDLYDVDVWEYENMKDIDIQDPIKLGFGDPEDWKYRYYMHHYGAITEYDQEQLIVDMWECYMGGIRWINDYYFKSCVSYTWQYPFNHAAFASDFKYCEFVQWPKEIVISPIAQLLMVIPPSCKMLLPSLYQKLMVKGNLIHYFPILVKFDMLYKVMLHQCIPLVPIIDIEDIMKYVDKIKLTNDELVRNKMFDESKFIKV